MNYNHLFSEDLPDGVKSIYYMGKRVTLEEFKRMKEKSNLKKESKLTL